MASLALTLNTAEQTLLNTQTELATSSNNISNASTPGYAEETAVQTENPAISTMSGWLGTGASITTVTQARDNFVEQQLMNAMTSDSQYSSLASQLTTIQSTASDSGNTGISEALGNFFNAWSTLAQDPTGSSEQTAVYSAAHNLVSAIQSTYDQLNQIGGQIPGQISSTVTQANSLISQIATLNTDILRSSAVSQPNNLIDQRYEAMDSLAKLIPVTFSTNSDGTVNVNTTEVGSSVNLISGTTVAATISSTSGISGGELGGLLQAQTSLNGYLQQFNAFVGALGNQINTVSGLSVASGSTASSISMSSNFLSGLTSTQLGAIAQNMSNLQDNTVSFSYPSGSSSTLQGYLDSIQQTIGTDVQDANNNQSFYDSLKSQLQTQQQSISGVSLDQEMVSVIQYQQIYQAAAKVIQTASTLMSTAINMVQ
jgi:flagellar hook-associated protein 1 FlgK